MGSHKTMGTLQAIDTDILTLSVVCLTGGHDVANVPLLTFPASAHPHLEFWSCERLGQLLRHYLTWMSVTSHARSVACLADLRNASKDVISVIVDSVEKLEISSRGTVSSVYFLKPANKARSRLLKKMLGLKPSKKMPKIPLFKVVLMKTHQELFNQIDLCQLTPEFGGTLTYDHAAWMKFYEMVAPCLREAENLKKRVPDLKDRVELLQDYDIQGHSVAGIQRLLNDLTQSFQHSLSEAAFQVTLDRLKQVLLTLDSSQEVSSTEASSALARVHTEHVQQATERVRELYTQLEGERIHLEDTWRTIEDGLTVHLQIQRHRERAAEIEKRMKTHYEPLLLEHPSVGSTLSQAELYRTHFTTTLYEPSKELLSQATEILEDVQRLRERMSHVSPRCDVTDILARLTVALQPFTHRLQSLQDVYVSVHIFHLLFQKALTWYRKVLKFLPEGLESRAEAEGDDDVQEETSLTTSSSSSLSSSGPNKILQMPVEWQVAVQSFLHKHPPPREQHLARLDTEIPPQVDKGLRVQARSLALRLRLLQRFLYSRRVSAKLLGTVFKWRAEVLSSSSSTSSTPQPKSPKHLNHRGEDSSLVSRQDAGQPPPKPARLFAAMRCANSFSSSEGGDTDNAHVRLFPDQTGVEPAYTFARHEIDAAETLPSNHPLGVPEIIQNYQKPPKLDIKIISPSARESDGDKSDPQQSGTSDEVVSGSDLILAAAQENPGDERFIRLTFTPPAASSLHRHSYAEDSLDSEDLAFRYPDTQTGSESGIDVLETEDPWDSIIDRIKAVSNSNLPSDVKIQCMSHLLSQSTGADSSPRPREPSTYPGVTSLQPQSRGEDLLGRDVAGFNQFRQHIGVPQDTDVRRHQSFAIAREDVRPPHRRQQDGVVPSLSQSELCAKAGKPDRRGCSSAGSEPFDPLHHKELEKPANTVARMRHRLARSLMDLDDIDQHSGPEDVYRTVRFKNPRPDRRHVQTGHRAQVYSSAAEFPAVGRVPKHVSFSHASRLPPPPPRHPQSSNIPHPQDRPRTTRAMDSLTRSYEGGLDTAHLSQPRTSPNKLVAWRSHEDGLDSLERPSFLPEKPPDKSASSETAESGSDSGKRHVAVQHVQRPSASTRKNPNRWRQGIVEDYLASPTVRERRKSKEFIAPSFLKPFHSMHNLHLVDTAEFSTGAAAAAAAPLTLLPEMPRGAERVATRVRGHYVGGGQRDSESDSLSEGSRLGGRKSSLEMLSDEVDQEYLSQDEVHSSLQRSQRILMETEDALRLRTKQQRDVTRPQCNPTEADDTRPLSAPVYTKVPDHVHDYTAIQRRHWNSEQHETQVPAPYIKPVQIRISAVEDTNGLDVGTDASASPDQDCVTSNGMTAEGEFDADVSNLSDSNLDSDKRQESV